MSYQFSNNESFVNPYTFVKGKNTVERSEKEQKAGTHTGVFTCLLYPKTPLLIPDASGKKEIPERETENVKHYSYPFFRLGKQPVIPGSSIRGPLRSVYEALTDSCYSTARLDQYITSKPKKAFQPGLLIKNSKGWELYSATRYRFQIQEYLNALGIPLNSEIAVMPYEAVMTNYGEGVKFQGSTVNIVVDGRNIPQHYVNSIGPKKANKNGYYCIGEYISNKKYESIFVKGNRIPVPVPRLTNAFESLKAALKLYQDTKINQKLISCNVPWNSDQHGGYSHIDLENFEKNGGTLPIWYKKINNQYYFSFASIGRFQYYTPIDKLLKIGGKMPCSGLKKLCKACNLFGMVGKEEGLGSSIRITDAVAVENPLITLQKYNLTELRTPHPSYLPFYAVTNDYLAGYDGTGCNIRGRKFYWHFMPDYEKLEQLPPDKRDAEMEGVKENQGNFQFKVYFEKLSREQVLELAVLLCLGENKESGNYCFKLGHGKPLGFGSAKIVVDKLEMRNFDPEQPMYEVKTYNLRENLEEWKFLNDLFEEESWRDILDEIKQSIEGMRKVLSFDPAADGQNNAKVTYPNILNRSNIPDNELNENELASSQWFLLNWRFGSNNPQKTLPDCQDENQTLPSAEFRNNQGAGNPRNRRR